MVRILILGGAARTDAACALLQSAGADVQVYWSRSAGESALPCAASLRDGLTWADALVDVTHAFDTDLRDLARTIAPHMSSIRYARPLWTKEPGDAWQTATTMGEAVGLLSAGARVFAATGRESAEILGHHTGPVFLRQLQQHEDPAPKNVQYVFGSGPFDIDTEDVLFRTLEIDVVLARNVGGRRSYPKIAAARHLNLPVVMVQPDLSATNNVAQDDPELLDWVRGLR